MSFADNLKFRGKSVKTSIHVTHDVYEPTAIRRNGSKVTTRLE